MLDEGTVGILDKVHDDWCVIIYPQNSAYEDEDNGMHDAIGNIEIISAVQCGLFVDRKTSAAMPFDLERARLGDVVEFYKSNEWLTCKIEDFGDTYFTVIGENFGSGGLIADCDKLLKMKFPVRKVL